jgi:hypothetical protein
MHQVLWMDKQMMMNKTYLFVPQSQMLGIQIRENAGIQEVDASGLKSSDSNLSSLYFEVSLSE